MIRRFDQLIPSFLKKIDRNLLLNRPGIWASQIHYLVFFALIGLGFVLLHASLIPVKTWDIPDPEIGFVVLFIPCAMALAIWAWRVSLFKVEKGFGIREGGIAFRDQLIYAAGILMLAAIPFVYSNILANRIANAVDPYTFNEDLLIIEDGREYIYGQPEDVRLKLVDADIITISKKINTFRSTLQKYSDSKSLPETDQLIDYIWSRDKNIRVNIQQAMDDWWVHKSRIRRAHNQYFDFQDDEVQKALGLVFAGIFFLMMLGFATSWKTLFWSLLAGGGMIAITGLIMSFSYQVLRLTDSQTGLTLYICTFIFLLYQGYRNKNTKRANILKRISLILATVMTPFFPLFVAELTINVRSDSAAFSLLYLGMFLTLIAWNQGYYPRFVSLVASPKDN